MISGADGRSNFDKLHTHVYDDQVVLYAFDLIEMGVRFAERKAQLAVLLSRGQDGIYFSEHLDDDGELIFKHCGFRTGRSDWHEHAPTRGVAARKGRI